MIYEVASLTFLFLFLQVKNLSTGKQQHGAAVHMHPNPLSGNVAPIILSLSSAEAAEIRPHTAKHTGSVQS